MIDKFLNITYYYANYALFKKDKIMAFVSRNPKAILNPETAENCVSVEPKNLQVDSEFLGYYKNCYTESEYNNKCYVFKSKDDGKDYLFYGTKALHNEMVYYSQGDLISIIYQGEKIVKSGKFAGKPFHAWKVTGENAWIPSPEFIAELQKEVHNRRIEVQQLLSTNGHPIQQAPRPQGFGNPAGIQVTHSFEQKPNQGFAPQIYPKKQTTDPFG